MDDLRVDDDEITQIGFRLTRKMKRDIKIQSAKTGESIQSILDRLVREYLEGVNSSNQQVTVSKR